MSRPCRYGACCCLLLALLALPFPAPFFPRGDEARAAASTYPYREVSLVLPSAEGSQAGLYFSLMQPALRRYAKEAVIMRSVQGRGGGYGFASLAGKAGDGYSLSALYLPTFLLLPKARNSLYAEKEIAPIAVFAHLPAALWVDKASPVRDVSDLVRLARQGTVLTLAGSGSYTDQHMLHLMFDRAAGVKSVYMPLLGSVQAIEAVRGNAAAAAWGYALPGGTMEGMRAIAVAAPERSAALPGVPTFREQKLDLVGGQYVGICMPAAAPEKTRQEVSDFFSRVAADPELLAGLAANGIAAMSVPYRDMPDFMARRQAEVLDFIGNYAMFPANPRENP